jgi:HK97 gp10 family phage protein
MARTTTTRVEVKGLREVGAALKQLPPRLLKRTLIAAVTVAGKVVLDELHQTVPVRTGRLAASLTLSRPRTRRGSIGILVGPSKEGFYAKFLEWGTSELAPRPFMRPALDGAADEAIDAFAARAGRDLPDDVRAVAAPPP